ncbi:hypothetical protein QQS21_003777 [Conoideocrella luteorostrata]|uniref:Uncharacterized protein n=1 Tax=Conoideocrella luteorostrata TaxID=1105319 RepID=A0AAJ0FW33_9HYPO|nr:hypothetical protein QQS21_003777 [Conoideocrella luteorostrata]
MPPLSCHAIVPLLARPKLSRRDDDEMDEQAEDTPGEYARIEDLFVDHRATPFDIRNHLMSLKSTAFEAQPDCLPEEPAFLPIPHIDLEAPKDEYTLSLQKLRDPDLVKTWLPLLKVDVHRDEGLVFPPRAAKLGLFLWHELENEEKPYDAADAYVAEVLRNAEANEECIQPLPTLPRRYLHEDLFELSACETPPKRDGSEYPESEQFISGIDATPEPTSPKVQNPESPASVEFVDECETYLIPLFGQRSPQESVASSILIPLNKRDGQQANAMPSQILDNSDEMCTLSGFSSTCHREKYMEQSISQTVDDRVDPTVQYVPIDKEPDIRLPIKSLSLSPSISKYFPPSPNCRRGVTTNIGRKMPDKDEDTLAGDEDAPNGQATTDTLATENTLSKGKEMLVVRTEKRKESNPNKRTVCIDHHGTNSLLSGFMEMRGVSGRLFKTNALSGASNITKPPAISCAEKAQFQHHLQPVPSAEALNKELKPAIMPDVSLPSHTGCCLVSLQLGDSLTRHLEELWPPDHLIDRDYSHRLTTTDAQHAVSKPTMSFSQAQSIEVDISLDVDKGIIVTTLLQIKQKALPGSNILPTVRQRVFHLCQKYRTLIVFVSEAAGAGETMSELSSSDLAAYIDFVCFASSMKAQVTVYFIPGAEKTLSRWILSMMVQHTSRIVTLHEGAMAGNTTWELFLRQSGMSVRAAQTLSHSLFHEFGPSGLRKFLAMSAAQRLSRYGSISRSEGPVSMAAGLWDDNFATTQLDI